MTRVRAGDVVAIHYEGRLDDGSVFDASGEGPPLRFAAGSEELIPGVSHAVIGMAEGESKTVTLPPEEAYGPRREDFVQRLPRNVLPEGAEVGARLSARAQGRAFEVVVREIADDHVVVDANHPLAGKTLVFHLTVVSIERP
jgi:peptidylprolyl isomerase